MSEPIAIYNCETCMFFTRNKKDYTRHLKSQKHLENHPSTTVDDSKPVKTSSCAKCNKVFKSRTSIYTHMKKCNNELPPLPPPKSDPTTTSPQDLTPEQIQYLIMENKILKELLKNAIQGNLVHSV